jgi:hypothetical protein
VGTWDSIGREQVVGKGYTRRSKYYPSESRGSQIPALGESSLICSHMMEYYVMEFVWCGQKEPFRLMEEFACGEMDVSVVIGRKG